jgi:hypothetical protein
MIKFIFEDSDNTPSSLLLKSCYNGDNIHFSNGGSAISLFRSIKKCKESDLSCTVIVFFDFPPNNIHAYNNYEYLIDYIDNSGYTNVYVVPILCIEYYIIKLLVEYNYIDIRNNSISLVNNLIKDFNYNSSFVQKYISSKYNSESIEHVYKSLLSDLASYNKCCKNSFRYNKDNSINTSAVDGKFYINDCNCERKFCKKNCTDNLVCKAERLYTELPIFDIIDDSHIKLLSELGISTKLKDLGELYDDLIIFFDNISKRLGVETPYIYDLTK